MRREPKTCCKERQQKEALAIKREREGTKYKPIWYRSLLALANVYF